MTSRVDHSLVAAMRDGLRDLGDPANAPRMQRYMKSVIPYHGVKVPEVRRLARSLCSQHALADRATWEATVRAGPPRAHRRRPPV